MRALRYEEVMKKWGRSERVNVISEEVVESLA